MEGLDIVAGRSLTCLPDRANPFLPDPEFG
jgi:hypothetical protein